MMLLLHQGKNVRSKYNLQVGKVHLRGQSPEDFGTIAFESVAL